jgi:hypothetical protein
MTSFRSANCVYLLIPTTEMSSHHISLLATFSMGYEQEWHICGFQLLRSLQPIGMEMTALSNEFPGNCGYVKLSTATWHRFLRSVPKWLSDVFDTFLTHGSSASRFSLQTQLSLTKRLYRSTTDGLLGKPLLYLRWNCRCIETAYFVSWKTNRQYTFSDRNTISRY